MKMLFYFYFDRPGIVCTVLYVAWLIGVDISPCMVEVDNVCTNTQSLKPHEMHAVGSLAELQQQRGTYPFSLSSNDYLPKLDHTFLQCLMVYHHFALVEDVMHKLVVHLKLCSTLPIADILHVEVDEGEPPIMGKYKHMVVHMHGFTKEEMHGVFEGTGLENVTFEHFASTKKDGRDVLCLSC